MLITDLLYMELAISIQNNSALEDKSVIMLLNSVLEDRDVL